MPLTSASWCIVCLEGTILLNQSKQSKFQTPHELLHITKVYLSEKAKRSTVGTSLWLTLTSRTMSRTPNVSTDSFSLIFTLPKSLITPFVSNPIANHHWASLLNIKRPESNMQNFWRTMVLIRTPTGNHSSIRLNRLNCVIFRYCTEIARSIWEHFTKFNQDELLELCDLAESLHYGASVDVAETQWIHNLRAMIFSGYGQQQAQLHQSAQHQEPEVQAYGNQLEPVFEISTEP